jgi:hypothetical protein
MRRMYKNLSPEEMDLSIKLCKILMKTSVVCKILVNFSSISIYANDYAFLRSVVTKLNSSQIRELWSPITPIKKDTIIRKTPIAYKYKVTMGNCNDIIAFGLWLESNQSRDTVLCGKKLVERAKANKHIAGYYFYVRDDKVLSLMNLITKVRRVEEVIVQE